MQEVGLWKGMQGSGRTGRFMEGRQGLGRTGRFIEMEAGWLGNWRCVSRTEKI